MGERRANRYLASPPNDTALSVTHEPAPQQLADRDRPSAWGAALLLIALGLALHLPRLHDPLSPVDQNAGDYFGPSLLAYEQLGFAELRGLPTWVQPMSGIERVYPYLTHPPGMFWIMAAFGTSEMAMRLPTVIGATLASIALLLLLRPIIGLWPAFAAGVCQLGVPAMSMFGQTSYAPVLLALGLLLFLSTLQLRTATGLSALMWRGLQVVCALVGPWIDWPFGLYCMGLAVVTMRWPLRAWLSDLVVPAVCSVASLVVFFGWRKCVAAAPFIRKDLPQTSFSEMAAAPFEAENRPEVADFMGAVWHFLTDTTGIPVAVLGTLGALLLLARSPKLVVALLIPAAGHILIFASHSMSHWGHYNYFAAPLAAGVAAFGAVRSQKLRPLASIALVVGVSAGWAAGISMITRNATTFARDFGQTALEATYLAGEGPFNDRVYVLHNFDGHLSYYAYSEYVINLPMTNPAVLEMMRNSKLYEPGFRYLWIQEPWWEYNPDTLKLAKYLQQFPAERLPGLERDMRAMTALAHDNLDIGKVFLVTLPFARAR